MDTMEFSRGDAAHHTLLMPASSWQAGGKLFFAAKPAIDDDPTDANALIQGSWTDTDVVDTTRNGTAYKQYNCTFPGSATNSVLSNGAESLDFLGEFQWVPASGDPVTFPAKAPKIPVTLYFDIKRKTT